MEMFPADEPVDYVLIDKVRHDFLIPSNDPADAIFPDA
jgi:hypothetical protein